MQVMIAGRRTTLARIRHRAGIEMRRAAKRLRHAGRSPKDRTVLLILGCQRSGTTMLSEVMARDPLSDVFPEKSGLSRRDDPNRLRLRPPDEIRARLGRNGADLVVLKPLVESQNARALLDALPRSCAAWMFRDYRDVVRSNLKMFGTDNGRRDLAAVLDDPDDWRGEHVGEETRRRLRDAVPDPTEAEAAALFWYARNAALFDQDLQDDPRLRIVPYETFVADPEGETRALYRLAGKPAPARLDRYRVFSRSVGAGRGVDLAPAVAALCDEMLGRLWAAHADQVAWDAEDPPGRTV